jgi:hypothetical protein
MANYTGIQGQNILIVDTDPANPTEGQIWYNTTSNLLKAYENVVVTAAWSSAPSINTARWAIANVGTQTAALAYGGYGQDPVGSYPNTESYNGTSWTAVNTLSPGKRSMSQTGTQTAALATGSGTPNGAVQQDNTQEWDGTSWTTGGNYPIANQAASGAGTQTAALAAGGFLSPGSGNSLATNIYNGTSWTTVPANTNAPGNSWAGNGSQTAAIIFGAGPGGIKTEIYNGTSWTSVADSNSDHQGGGGAGDTAAALVFSGFVGPSETNTTELWNGSTWTATSNMGTGVGDTGKDGGTASAAFQAGGYVAGSPAKSAVHQQFTGASVSLQTRTITTS